jgi:hypothetical protein
MEHLFSLESLPTFEEEKRKFSPLALLWGNFSETLFSSIPPMRKWKKFLPTSKKKKEEKIFLIRFR